MISALFCSVYPRGVNIAALPAHSWRAAWMGREFFAQNRTIPPNQNFMLSICHFEDIIVIS